MCQFLRSGYTCQVNIRFKVPIRVHYVGSRVSHNSNHFQKYTPAKPDTINLYCIGACLEF